ncbi:MAG: DUF92 domain-containing protein [Candidatus Micrarchaeota archaeon]
MSLMLDKKGLMFSFLLGIVVFVYGGKEYLAFLIIFLIISVIVTRYGAEEKKESGIYEYERSWENVLSNGIVPTLFVVGHNIFGVLPFITSVAAVTADKFGSELGVLGKNKPISLFSFKEVVPGTSGAMSTMGTIMSFAGALVIGACAVFIFGVKPTTAFMIGVGGFLGSIADSIAGVFEERGIGNKSSSNIICSIIGGVAGSLLR